MKEERCGHFGPMMGYCDHQLHKNMNRELQKYDVSPMQCRVLMQLYARRGEMDQKALQELLMVKASTVNGIVERLEEKGMITRAVKPTDARGKVLRLTEEGCRFHDAFLKIEERLHRQMERGFSREELLEFHEYLRRVAENLETEEPEC